MTNRARSEGTSPVSTLTKPQSYGGPTTRKFSLRMPGDDDTLFFVPNVLRLLKRLDPTIPLALSDNLW